MRRVGDRRPSVCCRRPSRGPRLLPFPYLVLRHHRPVEIGLAKRLPYHCVEDQRETEGQRCRGQHPVAHAQHPGVALRCQRVVEVAFYEQDDGWDHQQYYGTITGNGEEKAMTKNYSVRTDLALEERERFESDQVEISGVILEEDYDESSETRITRVIIETENGAKAMGKPAGTYLTLESPALAVPDEEEQMRISEKIRDCISELLRKNFEAKEGKEEEDLSILVVGLGNRNITPDALGPCVADHLNVTRHIIREYGKYAMGVEHAKLVSAIVPGVMGQTGMETTEIVRGIVRETRPDLVIAVDALAARNSRRLNRTIQIADTGIHPGSGVGNYRNGMTKESLGVPVIGIGVPTVVDAATIVNDTMENFIHALEESETLKSVGETLRSYNQGEKYELVKELIAPHLNGMFVTPKDVDEMIHQISHTIAEALNLLCSHIIER